MRKRLNTIIFLIILLCGCSDIHFDKRLESIDRLCSENPKAALSKLDSIKTRDLTDYNSHFYELLHVKARDKADLPFESEEMVLNLADYFSNNKKLGKYYEALYYCGRYYMEAGDYPSALRYYQQALEEIPEQQKGSVFEATIFNLVKSPMYATKYGYIKRV